MILKQIRVFLKVSSMYHVTIYLWFGNILKIYFFDLTLDVIFGNISFEELRTFNFGLRLYPAHYIGV